MELDLSESSPTEEEDIHSHCAGFESTVLRGPFTQAVFRITPGDTHTMFRYRFDAIRGESEADRNGLCSVRQKSRKTFRIGDGYVLEFAAFRTSAAAGLRRRCKPSHACRVVRHREEVRSNFSHGPSLPCCCPFISIDARNLNH